jgi:hypothetical protein
MKGVDDMQCNVSMEIKNQIMEDLEDRIISEEDAISSYQNENEYHLSEIEDNKRRISESTEKIKLLKSLIAELGIE